VILDAYTVVFLRRSATAPELSEEESDRIQEEHLAFNARMRAEGKAVITGPVTDQPDRSLRGINVFRTSVEETRRLMAQDPAVRAGRLVADVFTWLMPPGSLGDRPAAQITEE
jgi:uncharacterized protein YciI